MSKKNYYHFRAGSLTTGPFFIHPIYTRSDSLFLPNTTDNRSACNNTTLFWEQVFIEHRQRISIKWEICIAFITLHTFIITFFLSHKMNEKDLNIRCVFEPIAGFFFSLILFGVINFFIFLCGCDMWSIIITM